LAPQAVIWHWLVVVQVLGQVVGGSMQRPPLQLVRVPQAATAHWLLRLHVPGQI
jgi:hypothetical protein